MLSVVIDITHPPFGSENTFAGLYVAAASVSKGFDVLVIMRGDGIYAGLKGQKEPLEKIQLPPTESQVADILELDGRVVADKQALEVRGVTDDELIEGIEVVGTDEINDMLLGHGDHVVSF